MASSSSSSSPPPPDKLLPYLLSITTEISLADPCSSSLQKRNLSSLSRKVQLLAAFFEELLRSRAPFSRAAILCLGEILTVLCRFQTLVDTCTARWSRIRLALEVDAVSNDFHELTHDLSTLLDIFPLSEIEIADDVKELVVLLKSQCRRSEARNASDPSELKLRSEILDIVHQMEQEIVPEQSRLEDIFEKLDLDDSRRCRDEIARLEVEIRDQSSGQWTTAMVALLGLVRYAKCVLFGASTPRRYSASSFGTVDRSCSFSSEVSIPPDFRCPISLELMRDPVVVASGQTYDRESITQWVNAGHATCPKTGQTLSHSRLIPNNSLKNMIAGWCRDQNLPFEVKEAAPEKDHCASNKAALEAARMMALFLVQKLAITASEEDSNRIVHEIRQLAKTGSDNRAFIADAGAIPLLLPLMRAEDPSLQVNSVTALLNLSILDENKKRIMKAAGGIEGLIRLLVLGATWHARENAAATLLSVSSLHTVYRKRIGREPRLAEGLAALVKEGPSSSKRDGLITILNLAGVRDNVPRLVEGGVVEAVLAALGESEVAEMAVAVIAALAKRGGAEALGQTDGFVGKMVGVLRYGTAQAKEAAAAALVWACRLGGNGVVAELAKMPGIEWTFWGLMGSGTTRARRKAASLGRICRKWAAAVASRDVVDQTASVSSVGILTAALS